MTERGWTDRDTDRGWIDGRAGRGADRQTDRNRQTEGRQADGQHGYWHISGVNG